MLRHIALDVEALLHLIESPLIIKVRVDRSSGRKSGFLEVDIALGSFLGWIRVTELNGLTILDAEREPGLVGWAENFGTDSAVKEVMPETGKLAEFAKMIFAKTKAPPST
ncbi:hypothetical protein GIB67_008520 [Kingdonia uniflora]|uniref:Uncharacterized protein n=1 Tax=Kingdonia uniflora TaxID=39325 RepID=A0A7J7LFJ1_9MAGN|nr:hypothetical protein GIB67_008519 [Kingdonia uniflora]KAF6141343.1 hypothetical protein GIB67_008520 [Kingdonia uniflora]